jgi:hypothetical protein
VSESAGEADKTGQDKTEPNAGRGTRRGQGGRGDAASRGSTDAASIWDVADGQDGLEGSRMGWIGCARGQGLHAEG